jgi:hypothetical protein
MLFVQLHIAAEKAEFRKIPAVETYRLCYIMLTQPDDESAFSDFKQQLLLFADCFSGDELHALNVMALNFCVRRINEGHEKYNNEALELYKSGLEKGFIFDNGVLSRFAYYNIAAAGLQAGDLEWVRFFIHEYRNRLEKSTAIAFLVSILPDSSTQAVIMAMFSNCCNMPTTGISCSTCRLKLC